MTRSAIERTRLSAPRAGSAIVALAALACFCVTANAQGIQIGPRNLYPTDQAQAAHPDVPLVVRDAVQHIISGSRLIDVRPRIIGGEPAPVGTYPWVASLELKGASPRDGHFCGGAFIGAEWVVTAAHCVKSDSVGKIQVHSGSELERGGTIFDVDRVIVNEKYDEGTQDNDVALVHLASRYPGATIRLITANEADRFLNPGTLAIALGWGYTSEAGQVSNILRRVTVQIINNKVCNNVASYGGSITDVMVCAGFPEGGRDSCQGDSGGPLVTSDPQGGLVQIGIVSWGEGCARPLKFGVYTRVSSIETWVAEHTGIRGVASSAPAPAPAPMSSASRAAPPAEAAPAAEQRRSPPPRVRSNSRVELPGVVRAQARSVRRHHIKVRHARKVKHVKDEAAVSRSHAELVSQDR